MSKIHILPKEVAMQIAAGEVVERPSSVLKELIENAIDAKATEIIVHISQGGKKKIEVSDNGFGMDVEDLKKSFLEHATSKIQNIDDVYKLHTFGFRGEALSAVSAVSHLCIISKTKDDNIATKIDVEDNMIKDISNVARDVGTTVEVGDLFYNVPARLAYMKMDTTEYTHCIKMVLTFVLYYHDIGWKVYSNDKLIYDFIPQSFENRISQVFDKDFMTKFMKVEISQNNIVGEIYVPHMQYLYAKKGEQYIYVNNRYISDKIITNAIYDVYKNINANPNIKDVPFIAMIHLSEVDVNVHPRKLEVKFKDPNIIFSTINIALKNAFKATVVINPSSIENYFDKSSNVYDTADEYIGNKKNNDMEKYNQNKPCRDIYITHDIDLNNVKVDYQKEILNSVNMAVGEIKETFHKETYDEKKYNYMMIKNSFLVLEQKDILKIIDLHALHERILYEQLISSISETSQKQYLIIPHIISLNAKDYQILKSNIDVFEKIGFDISDIGNNNFEISSIPAVMTKFTDVQKIISSVLQDIENESYNIKTELPQHVRICKYMACRSAFMFGENIKDMEIDYLLSRVEILDNNLTCPHGRPIYFDVLYVDILKKVGR